MANQVEGQAQTQQTNTPAPDLSSQGGTTIQSEAPKTSVLSVEPTVAPEAPVAQDAQQPAEDAAKTSNDTPLVYELAMPQDSTLTKERVDEIAAFARERGLSPEVAQQLVDREHSTVVAYKQTALEQLEAQRDVWINELKADKEYGGERFAETCAMAQRAWNKYATPGLRELCKGALGDQKELIKTFARIGRQEAEDKLVTDKAPAHRGPKTLEERLYPSQG